MSASSRPFQGGFLRPPALREERSLIWQVLTGNLYAEVNLTKLVNKIRPAVATVIVYDADRQVNSIGSGSLSIIISHGIRTKLSILAEHCGS
jgi:hypothetical protein